MHMYKIMPLFLELGKKREVPHDTLPLSTFAFENLRLYYRQELEKESCWVELIEEDMKRNYDFSSITNGENKREQHPKKIKNS